MPMFFILLKRLDILRAWGQMRTWISRLYMTAKSCGSAGVLPSNISGASHNPSLSLVAGFLDAARRVTK
jgi:hypothetical protein